VVVYGRIRRWPTAADGRLVGGSGVGAGKRISPSRLYFRAKKYFLRQGSDHLLDL
jgi:hypothetical protein